MKTISLLAAAVLSVAALSVLLTQQPAQAVAARDTAVPTIQLTLEIADCEGCVVSLVSYVYRSTDFWSSKRRKVEDGSVTFAVPTAATLGVSMQVRAPWAAKRATACWAGTTDDAVTMQVKSGAHRTAPGRERQQPAPRRERAVCADAVAQPMVAQVT